MTEYQAREILFAHVVGEPNDPIAVSTKGLHLVSNLKTAFKQAAKSRIKKLAEVDFYIYSVNIPDDRTLEKEAENQLRELKASGKRLRASQPLTEYPHLVGMIGQVGVIGLLVELLDDPYDPPSWLTVFHNALWKKPHLKSEIFRKTTITFSQFLVLEERLNANNPTRTNLDNDEYAANHVSELKIEFLHDLPNTTPLQLPPDVALSYSDLNTLFPISVSYCDLSILNLKFLPGRCSSPILIRDEYTHFFNLLSEAAKDSKGFERLSSCVISGQTGMGKKTYLYLLLIERLLEGKRTYFQTPTGSVFRIDDSIELLHPSSGIKGEDGTAIALLDGRTGGRPSYIVQNTSYSNFASDGEVEVVRTTWAGLGASVLYETVVKGGNPSRRDVSLPLDFPYPRLKSSIAHFGHNPLRSFWASTSTSRMHEVKTRIKSIIENTNFSETDLYTIDEVFERHPKNGMRLFGEARIDGVSRWAIDLVLGQLRPEELETYPTRRYLELAQRMESESRELDVYLA